MRNIWGRTWTIISGIIILIAAIALYMAKQYKRQHADTIRLPADTLQQDTLRGR